MEHITKIAACLVYIVLIPWSATCIGLADKRDIRVQERRDKTAAKLIKTAEQYVGLRELTDNNDHPQITKWMKECGLRGDLGYPWCAAAQTGIHNEANVSNPESARVVDWFNQNITW